ncbi:hypothetical protein C4M83_06770, partial [Mycoplasmopsis pullorum]
EEKRNNYEKALNDAKKLVNNENPETYNTANLNFNETNDVYLKLKKAFEALNDEQNKLLNAAELEKLVNEAS